MPDPMLDAISTKTIGFMGESLTAFLLELEFGKKELRVAKMGEERLEWDLFIFEPARGTPFAKPTAIQVKARSLDNVQTGPTLEEFRQTRRKAEKHGYGLWFSFIHYRYKDGHMRFGAYLVPSEKIKETDFKRKREFGKEWELLRMADMKRRAVLKFHSRDMELEKRVEKDETPNVDAGAPLSVSKDQAGDWGEDMAAFLLASEYKQKDLLVSYVGRGDTPYDLLIDSAVDGTPFSRQAAISVKTVSFKATRSKPSFEELAKNRSALDAKGMTLWLALLKSNYRRGHLGFGMYLIDSHELDKEDFVDAPDSWQQPDLLSFTRARKKAVKRIWTEKMYKEDY